MLLAEAIGQYSALRIRRYAASTWKAHRGQLERFRRWVSTTAGSDIALADVDDLLVARYFDRLRPPKHSASAFNNYRQYLVLFFDFCRREGWISTFPMRHVTTERQQRKTRRILTASEVAAMMNTAHPRDRFALALGFNTALRAGDVAALTVDCINIEDGVIYAFVSKTQTEMRLPLTRDLRRELDRWFADYLQVTGGDGRGRIPGHWLLVPAMHFEAFNVWHPEMGGRITYNPRRPLKHPERIVHRGLVSLGLPTLGEGYHTLRRAAARHIHGMAVDAPVVDPIRAAQSLLGHQRQSTTEVYLGIARDDIERDRLMRDQPFMSWRQDDSRRADDDDGLAGVLAPI